MENAKESNPNPDEKPTEENPNPNSDTGSNPPTRHPSRTPFTTLSQLDADLALARTLQEQERAYMMLRMSSRDGSDYGSSETGSYVYEEEEDEEEVAVDDHENHDAADGNDAESVDHDGEDAFDVHARAEGDDELGVEIDPSAFDSDEAYARALQDAEERQVAVRLMALAGINDWEGDDLEDHDSNSQVTGSGFRACKLNLESLDDTWQEIDPDELSYEELLALGEVVGTESRGLSADTIASLPSTNYKAQGSQEGGTEQ
ncbi:hypothetical protein ACLOJK_000757 [Asimina triloba]